MERIDGQAAAVETPIGHVPAPGALDVDGLDLTPAELERALAVDVEEWKAEIPQIQEWFEKFGDQLPAVLWTELDGLRARLGRMTSRPFSPSARVPDRLADRGLASVAGCGVMTDRPGASGRGWVDSYGPEDRALFETRGHGAVRGDR